MDPSPDSSYAAEAHPSPNHGERRDGKRPNYLILHYTGMASGEAALARLCDPRAEVSSHYLVWEDGRISQLVPEARRAWHAGRSAWDGERDMNSCSIGIEIVNAGHDGGSPPFPKAQIEAIGALGRDIVTRHGIAPRRVLAHSDIAPGRKLDPGERFSWARLHRLGVGAWPGSLRLGGEDTLRAGDGGPRVEALRHDLASYGYDLPPNGDFDVRLRVVVEAFQRHFRPARVDGHADAETLAILRALLQLPPR